MKKSHSPPDAPHLGGHCFITHLDQGVLQYCKENLLITTMLDIGCGPGGMIDLALELGIDSYGVDGDYRLENKNSNRIIFHDYTKGKLQLDRIYDLAYSCEFVEHVDIKFVPNFMESFKKCKHVVITFAPPGTPGYHHVNCNTKEYWIETFKKFGLIFDADVTDQIKKVSTMKRNFIRDNGLYFKNESNNY